MSDQTPDELRRLVQELRNQVAKLITENLELSRQLEDLHRAKTDATVDALALSAISSVRTAEQAFADLSTDGTRYVVSELQTRYQGVILPQGEKLAFRVPLPEYGSAPGHLGSVQMTFKHAPPPAAAQVQPPPPDRLRAALERAQSLFMGWPRRAGAAPAAKIADLITRLLGGEPLEPGALLQQINLLSGLLTAFARGIQAEPPASAVEALQAAARQLAALIRGIDPAAGLSEQDLAALAAAIEQVNESLAGF